MIVRSHADLKKAYAEMVQQLSNGPFTMETIPVSPIKTRDQIRAWWKYCRKIEKEGESGYKAEEVNDLANERIIEPIYISHNIHVLFDGVEVGYADAYARIIQLLQDKGVTEYRSRLKELQKTVSKERLSTAQMSRALGSLEIWAAHEFKVALA